MCDPAKVGCAFPMVIASDFRMGKHRDDDYEEDTPYFRLFQPSIMYPLLLKLGFMLYEKSDIDL